MKESAMQVKYSGTGQSSSDAVIHNGLVYLPAIVSEQDHATAADQMSAILKEIDRLLAANGTSKRKMISATTYCSDARLFEEVNTRWDAWVPWHDPPACTFLVAKLATSGKRVSVQVTAAL